MKYHEGDQVRINIKKLTPREHKVYSDEFKNEPLIICDTLTEEEIEVLLSVPEARQGKEIIYEVKRANGYRGLVREKVLQK